MALEFGVRDRVAYLTLNRPEALNAFDPETLRELAEAWAQVRDNDDIWVAVVRGAGDRAFSTGMDLKKTIPQQSGAARLLNTQRLQRLEQGIGLTKPVVAAIHGYCLGGGLTLALACDLRIASEDATFGLPEIKHGVFPTQGATWRLPRQVPWAIAMELLVMGDSIDARRAHEVGLVNRVVPRSRLDASVDEVVGRLLALPPLTMRAVKESALRALETGLNETLLSRALHTTGDAREGVKAFAEKRPPAFTGE
ncbi:MAG: enoyl-CoA hydratase/isomerase family protein [Dehalococcoidia bacterium]|nr:enoyl-CoA hydratase/isomerase family protein [Dehalococcoidia bacterium]